MVLINKDNFLNNFKLLLNRNPLGETSAQESVSVDEVASLIKDEPIALDLESVLAAIDHIKTDNSCEDCTYKTKCDRLQKFYSSNTDVDFCALTTKHVAMDILKSALNTEAGEDKF